MKPIKIRITTKPRRNPIALTARQRQAGPHRDRRVKEARKLAQQAMRESMDPRIAKTLAILEAMAPTIIFIEETDESMTGRTHAEEERTDE